jgi:hypothetical protein
MPAWRSARKNAALPLPMMVLRMTSGRARPIDSTTAAKSRDPSGA